MAQDRTGQEDYIGTLKRILLGLLVLVLVVIFLIWRIDNPRVERFRAQVIDTVLPQVDWAMAPVTQTAKLIRDLQSYQSIYTQNQELRRELQKMKKWKEAAGQLEQENARLLDLNQLQLDPKLTRVSGIVMADSGSPFRQSVLINVGSNDGIQDGWAAMDGLGLVGRISGVGEKTSRVILLTDTSSRIPAVIQPSGQRAFVSGDNSAAPVIDFLENRNLARPGDRIFTSGDAGLLPPDLLIGQLAQDPNKRLRVRLSADFERLEFLQVLRDQKTFNIKDTGALIVPQSSAEPSEAAND